eukprot:gene28692-37014_t
MESVVERIAVDPKRHSSGLIRNLSEQHYYEQVDKFYLAIGEEVPWGFVIKALWAKILYHGDQSWHAIYNFKKYGDTIEGGGKLSSMAVPQRQQWSHSIQSGGICPAVTRAPCHKCYSVVPLPPRSFLGE